MIFSVRYLDLVVHPQLNKGFVLYSKSFQAAFFSFATEKNPSNVFIKRVKKQHILTKVLYRHKKS